MTRTILITGANGNISSGIISNLLNSGYILRALVRNPEKAESLKKRGIDVRMGDLEQPWTLPQAFEGVDRVWLLTAASPRAPEQFSNGLWAAKQAGVKHVVRMSAAGAAYNAPTINSRLHALSDAELAASGMPFTIIKPQFFAQNLMMAAGGIAQEGAMFMALGEGKLGIIDARDISDFAAHVLTTEGHAGKTYTLTGPSSVNMHQVAEAIGKAVEKPVQYVAVPLEGAQQAMAGMGLDEWTVNMLSDYFVAYGTNWGNLVTEDFQRVTGKAPRTIGQFSKDFAGVFGKK